MNPAESVVPVIQFNSLGSQQYGVDATGRILWRRGTDPWDRLPAVPSSLESDALASFANEVVALRKQIFNLQEILNDADPGFYGEQLPEGLEDLSEGDES